MHLLALSPFHHCCLHVPSELAASSSAADVTHEMRHVQTTHVTQSVRDYPVTY